GVGPVGRSAAQPRIQTHRELAAARDLAEGFQLVQRAGVEEHALAEELRQPSRRHLRGQLDLGWREARAQRALDLEVAGGIQVQAEPAEQLQDAEARIGLHGVAQREAEGRRERQRLAGGGLERRAVVDVAGRAEALANLGGAGGREATGGHHALRYAASTASAIWRVVAPPP